MPSNNSCQRIAGISKALKILRTQSLSHPDKAAEILSNAIGSRQVIIQWLTTLSGEGVTKAERDTFIEDKLACEHEKYVARQEMSLEATRKVLAQKDLNSLLQTMADGARKLIGTGVKP